jgi:hypothetical protein
LVDGKTFPLLQNLSVVGGKRLFSISPEWIDIPVHNLVDFAEPDSSWNQPFQRMSGRRPIGVCLLWLHVCADKREAIRHGIGQIEHARYSQVRIVLDSVAVSVNSSPFGSTFFGHEYWTDLGCNVIAGNPAVTD